MSDIVERLHKWRHRIAVPGDIELYLEAADEIERLRAALEHIAVAGGIGTDDAVSRFARRALEGKPPCNN